MAAQVKFSESHWRALLRAKSEGLSQVSSGDGIGSISSFFKIIQRLDIRPKVANPWLGEFTMDISSEVFGCT